MEACHTGHEVDAEQRARKNYGHIHPTPAGIRLRRKLMHYGGKILSQHEDATPRIMFTVVIAMFDHHNQPRRLLQVFADIEELEIKPDAPIVERVVKTYRGLGLLKRADAIEAMYPPTKWGYRYSKRGKKYRIRVTAEGGVIKPEDSLRSQAEAGVEEEDAEDSDSDYDDDYIYEEEPFGEESLQQESYLHNSESVLPSGVIDLQVTEVYTSTRSVAFDSRFHGTLTL